MKSPAVEQDDQGENLPSKVLDEDDGQLEHSSRLADEGSGSGRGSNNPEMMNQEVIGERFFPKTDLSGPMESGALLTEQDNRESLKMKCFNELIKVDDGNKDEATTARSRALQHAVSQGVSQIHVHYPQKQQQGSVIRWERFLPQHQLRVLLVEDDDSTRHVVSALLRNCSYEVTSAANGLLAWELLMDQSNQIDLVLTEVVMPILSGVALLTRIMSHEPLKHIPVIMMSSLDSMGIVFKCLSKGAVDFLVKPVRKNELKNLWQHIWRRCHSSSGSASGSGSGSGSQTQKAPLPAHGAAEANISSSNNEAENTSSELNIGGGSDNGSGTQSSWTKKAVEVESSHAGLNVGLALNSLPHVEQADNPEGESADVSLDLKVAGARGGLPDVEGDKDLADVEDDKGQLGPMDGMAGETTTGGDGDSDVATCLDNARRAAPMNLMAEVPTKDQESGADQQIDSENTDDSIEKHASNSPCSKDKTLSEVSSRSLLTLSLKRPCAVDKDEDHEVRGLKHSRSSAFSRYNNNGYRAPLPAGSIPPNVHTTSIGFGDHGFVQGSSISSNPQSSMPFDPQIHRAPVVKDASEAMAVPQFYTGIGHVSSNRDGTDPHRFPSGKVDVAVDDSVNLIGGSGPDMKMHFSHPELLGSFGSAKELMGPSSVTVEVQNFSVSFRSNQSPSNVHVTQDPRYHHHHHHHHHHIQHHHHHHHLPDQPQKRPVTPQQEDSTMMEVGDAAPQCGSSNMVKGPAEGNNGQSGSSNGYGSNGNGAVSLNGSVAGSNNGSNGGQSAAVELGSGGNIDSGAQLEGMAAKHGTMAPGPEQSRLSMREAALTKFRQKRKERCFEKKVRYQSRKRLAEQRPRVRGQFVRRSVP